MDVMPTFTVLTPHYNEKVCFPLAMFLLQSFRNILNYRSCFRYGKSSKSRISISVLRSFVTQTNSNASLSAWPITSSNSSSPCSSIPSSTKKNTRMPSSCFALIQNFRLPISRKNHAKVAANHGFTLLLSTVVPSSIHKQGSVNPSSELNFLAIPFLVMQVGQPEPCHHLLPR